MKTNELTGAALVWAVTACELRREHGEGVPIPQEAPKYYDPVSLWDHGGPIIEREGISVLHTTMRESHAWEASITPEEDVSVCEFGPTPLIAAMRCLVALKLGDEVEIPEALK